MMRFQCRLDLALRNDDHHGARHTAQLVERRIAGNLHVATNCADAGADVTCSNNTFPFVIAPT